MPLTRILRFLPVSLLAVLWMLGLLAPQVEAAQTVTLPNGDYVVVDPDYDLPGPVADVGAVSFYTSGGQFAGMLRGGMANDQVGSGGITLSGGTFIIHSPQWDNGSAVDAGAATVVMPGFGPVSGVVSAANSLVGSSTHDQIGSGGITADNDSFIIRSPLWDNGSAADAGAATVVSLSFGPVFGVVAAELEGDGVV